ncbi:MAG: hypothetical protein HND58_11640 [Planctomycetota bacterium]|nr:MAG: hypothetical protein HND58_11640 [Planctomycetota bacterium]
MWWAVPLVALGGCRVRVHVVSVVFALALLAYAVWNGLGPTYVATGLVALAAVVGLHEAARGHALVRWFGGRPLDVTLWPLGGVWRFDDGSDSGGARSEGVGAAVGLGMLVAVAAAAGTSFALITGSSDALVFEPLRPGVVMGSIRGSSTPATVGLVTLWQVYAAAVYVLAFNLLPMLPLDEGVLVRAVFDRGGSRALAPPPGLVDSGGPAGGWAVDGVADRGERRPLRRGVLLACLAAGTVRGRSGGRRSVAGRTGPTGRRKRRGRRPNTCPGPGGC